MNPKKNILLVSFDDATVPWPYKTALNEPLQTPNIDRLCDVSTAFHSAYAQSPVCGPSRASMMKTMMPHEIGILDNSIFSFDVVPAEIVWTHQLKENGYYCSSGGKVHHRYKALPPRAHNILYDDQRKSFSDDMSIPKEIKRHQKRYGGHRDGRGLRDGIDDDFFYDKQVSDSAIEFLEQYDGDQPFYREVGFFSPHAPWTTPARFKEMYDARNFRRPDEWNGYVEDNDFVKETLHEQELLREEKFWQDCSRNYFSAYSHGDYHLGRVLDALWNSPHAENTIVVLVSDHGMHLGNRNLFRKMTMWEQSLRVPFIIFDPSAPKGQVIDDPVGLIDLGPTVLDYAGVPPIERAHGKSLRPMVNGERDPGRMIPSFLRENVSMRKDNYRIIRYGDDSYQLFDINEDVWQLRDLGTNHKMFAPMQQALKECSSACGFDF